MPNLEITAVVEQMIKSDILMLDTCTDKVNDKTWKLNMTKLLNVVEEKNFFLSEFKSFLLERFFISPTKNSGAFF